MVDSLEFVTELAVRSAPEPEVAMVASPDTDPAAMEMATLEAAVISPFPLTVKEPTWEASPKLPTLLLTVARVVANEPPGVVMSPVRVPIRAAAKVPATRSVALPEVAIAASPDTAPAAIEMATEETAVVSPFALTVTWDTWEASPKVPTFELTVASVVA
jgi:hypothetical protein